MNNDRKNEEDSPIDEIRSTGLEVERPEKSILTDEQEDSYVEAIAEDTVDTSLEQDDALPNEKRSFFGKIKHVPLFWWQHKKLRYGSIVFSLLLAACLFLIPSVRYGALNIAGVRVTMSTHVVDSQTSLPLENIPVMIQGQEKRTDEDGFVAFDELKLGSSELLINKSGYARYENNLVLGWGSNPLKNQPLVATGTQFAFIVTDWLSDNPIVDAEARSGEDIAIPDEAGKITLTVGELDDSTEAVITAEGYRAVTVLLSEAAEQESLRMVPERKHVFVSNRDGVYDLYKKDIDGKNEEVLLAATGKEREIPHAVVHPEGNHVAYISTRDGEANSGGFIYDGLFIVDVRTGESNRILRSEQVQIIGWSGDRVIYTAITEGVSGSNPERSKIFSFDIFTGDKVELATSNYFNDVQLVRDHVYYSVSSFAVPASSAKLFSVQPDGQNQQTVVDSQVWTIVHAGYNTLHFQAVDESFSTVWYTKEGEGDAQKLDAPPVTQTTRYYSSSPNGEHALRVDERDGKGVLLSLNIATGEEQTVQSSAGLTEPVYWVNDRTVVFRIANSQESADYVISLDGGEPRKIADVIGNQSRYFY